MKRITRRSALGTLLAAPAAFQAIAQEHARPATRLFLGTYTDMPDMPPGSKGIYECHWHARTGRLTPPRLAVATPNPSFLARSAKHPEMLFAVNEEDKLLGQPTGGVSSFEIHPGGLRPLRTVSSGGTGPCHLTLDHTGRALFVANYDGGALSTFHVTGERLSKPVSIIPFHGHSVDPDRQTAPHTHGVLLSPDNNFLLVNDLGLDRILVFEVHPAEATLTPAQKPFFSMPAGSGPRHSRFHPNGKWVYVVNELNSTVDQLAWDADHGSLALESTHLTVPHPEQKQGNHPAELAIDSTGQFLYVSNRGHDSIAVLTIDQQTGGLHRHQDIPCGGRTPRFFTLDPTEKWLLVANQDTSNIAVFSRDSETGQLTATGDSYNLAAPVCLLFA